MIISQEELERRLNSSKNLNNIIPSPSASVKDKTVTPAIDHIDNTDKIDKMVDKIHRDAAASNKENVRESAIDMMVQAISKMTEDKLENASAKDLSAISSNMAKVVQSLTPKDATNSKVQIVIYSPTQKTEASYDVIDIG